MSARIYVPAKTAMQSGKNKSTQWCLEFEATAPKTIDPLTGKAGSSDMDGQMTLWFATREEAIAYAQNKGVAYKVEEPKLQKRRLAAYSDNFKYDNLVSWTH